MLRLGKRIRLTSEERAKFKCITGQTTLPTTIDQHNWALGRTAEFYRLLAAQENSADAELLARIAEGELITAAPASEPDKR
ncbi:hypothetical protein LMG29542_05597 [Paraburkholderia humisilvae]|uniref:Uncharacterized protein n=1 Tax=Paraburkholderia humisilvae TaxID=627669 RepID=A0A6J5ELM0_9BURK|nr:hypothetical protein LMG29542_05597 [Paraburkholderia humisilvae]